MASREIGKIITPFDLFRRLQGFQAFFIPGKLTPLNSLSAIALPGVQWGKEFVIGNFRTSLHAQLIQES